MSRNPFDPTPDRLPRTLPIFPLPGVLLLPRGRLPLNIFEPRYLAMVQAALGSDRMIGMVQPLDPSSRSKTPPVYETGCAGRITTFNETDDGRFLITLTGVSRFHLLRELPLDGGGFRRVQPAWERYTPDLEEEDGDVDRSRLLAGLRPYFKVQGISANWEAIEGSPCEKLVTSLAMICPFEPSEKQALLEAPDLAERGKLLIALIEMAILDDRDTEGSAARH